MRLKLWGAAVFAALSLFMTGAEAQDVTLTARDGSLSIDGQLIAFDGEFYRVDSRYGPLTLDGEGVICEGPGCPDLTATLAVLRISGAGDPGNRLLPGLFEAGMPIGVQLVGRRNADDALLATAAALQPFLAGAP